jgi:hypothetical protein
MMNAAEGGPHLSASAVAGRRYACERNMHAFIVCCLFVVLMMRRARNVLATAHHYLSTEGLGQAVGQLAFAHAPGCG